jgi:Cu2+-exporting ATPase
MDTETKKLSSASNLLAKAFGQTGISVLAIVSLLIAAILNHDLWLQFGIVLVLIALSHLLVVRIKKMIKVESNELQEQKSSKEIYVDQAAKYWPIFTIVISSAAVLFAMNNEFNLSSALTVFSAGLLLTNSQALALVIPLSVSRTLKAAADSGILVRSREAFERIAKLSLVLFTKGGLLTNSPTGVNSVRLSTKSKFKDESKLLALVASVESMSNHAFALAIVKSAGNSNLRITKPKAFKEIPGFGVEGTVAGKHVLVGSTALLLQRNIRMEVQELIYADESTKSGFSIVCVVVDGTLEGIFRFTDIVKPTSVNAVYQIARERIRVGILTGDSAGTAREKADQVNISEVYAELSPDLKVLFVSNQQAKGVLVGVIANPETDSSLLEQADVGLALGSIESESVEISVPGDDPEKASEVVSLSAQLRKKTNLGLTFAFGYGLAALGAFVAIVSPLQVATPPAFTALLGSLSLLVVAINSYSIGKLK